MITTFPDVNEFDAFEDEVGTVPAPVEHKFLFNYWKSIHPGQLLPGRQHFEPQAISGILKDLWILDVIGPPIDFRFRLVGTNLVEITGVDLTGQLFDIDDARSIHRARAVSRLRRVVADKISARGRERVLYLPNKDYIYVDALHLPLARDGGTVDMIVSVSVFSFADGFAL